MAGKLTKKAIKKTRSRHNWCLQWCWNYERMQACGYAYAMVPVIKELYEDEEKQCRELERHMQFYNCHPGGSALIIGANVALEEKYETKAGDNLKVSLMGPLAAIGDTIQATFVSTPFNIIAAGLAAEENWLSVLVITLPVLAMFMARYPLFNYGYRQGKNVISDVNAVGSFDKLSTTASVLGMVVVGGFIPSVLSTLKIKDILLKSRLDNGQVFEQILSIQEGLDGIFPYLLPILLTAFCYWLIKVRKLTPILVLIIIATLAFIVGTLNIIA